MSTISIKCSRQELRLASAAAALANMARQDWSKQAVLNAAKQTIEQYSTQEDKQYDQEN